MVLVLSAAKGVAMAFYLGVDGGGTGCRAAVADADGVVLGRGAAAAANVFTDPEGARANVVAAAEAALAAAGRPVTADELIAALGLAGLNVGDAAERLAAALPFARARVVTDAHAAARGALGTADGVAAAIGTGSVFAAQRGGAMRFLGGWGFVLGDHGSGARMGRELLEAALLAHDGLAPRTLILDAALAEAGGPEALVAWARAARPADFARHAPRLIAAADAGDPAAAAILARAEAAVAASIDALRAAGPVPVAFLGGLGPVFAARLTPRYGDAVRAPLGDSLDGALALARELG
jgi:glucosamine kinase